MAIITFDPHIHGFPPKLLSRARNTIAVLCAKCGFYHPILVEIKNILSLLRDWSECDADTEDDSDASTDDVYDDNVDRYRRGAEATLKEDKSSHHGRN
ncbi:hypothetical protein G3M48_008765 [Beauveria asiatica]|uniref:Uncharacterized protein n=1 Tax=Beauveria asiatica TaxID=1069075 RepID=A0AAW0RJR5_9HYPO